MMPQPENIVRSLDIHAKFEYNYKCEEGRIMRSSESDKVTACCDPISVRYQDPPRNLGRQYSYSSLRQRGQRLRYSLQQHAVLLPQEPAGRRDRDR